MAGLIKFWQAAFILIVLATVALFIQQSSNLRIDTDLADMTPATRATDETRNATAALRDNIEKRIIVLITSTDEDALFDAEDALRSRLGNVINLKLLPNNDDLAENVLEGLKPFRFSLLTHDQQLRLSTHSPATIADQTVASLLSLDGQLRVYSYADDPLGWHSETLLTLLPNNDPTHSGFHTAVGASIERGALNMQAQADLEQTISQAINKTKADHGVDIYTSGVFFFASEAAQKSKQDISLITGGSSIGVVLLLLLVFRSFRALSLPITSVLLGVGFAFTLTHFVFGSVHVLTIVFGASLIGIVIDYSLHYFYHGADQQSHNNDAQQHERKALFRALSLSLMTSMIGYAALGFSSLEALQKVAFFSCCGLFMAWLSVISLGDLALRKPISVQTSLLGRFVNSMTNLCALVPKTAWQLTVLAVLIAGLYSYAVIKPFNDDPRIFFKANASLLANEQRVSELTSDYEPGRHFVVYADDIDTLYKRHEALLDVIKSDDTLNAADVTSLLSWVPSRPQQRQHYTLQNALYKDEGAADILAQLLKQESTQTQAIKNAYQVAFNRYLNPADAMALFGDSLPPIWYEDGSHLVNFVLIKKGLNADHFEAKLEQLEGVEYVNTLQRTEQALSSQRRSANTLLLLAYTLVALVLCLRMRSFKGLGLVLTPLCATSMVFLSAAVVGFDLNLFHIMALFLVLGFGMDYSIFAYEMREHSNLTLQAILLSAITSLLSFGLLGLSSIPVVASFGITLLIGNSFNLIGVIIYSRLINPVEQYEQ